MAFQVLEDPAFLVVDRAVLAEVACQVALDSTFRVLRPEVVEASSAVVCLEEEAAEASLAVVEVVVEVVGDPLGLAAKDKREATTVVQVAMRSV